MNMIQNILVFAVCFAVAKWFYDGLEEARDWERAVIVGGLDAVALIFLFMFVMRRIDGLGKIAVACSVVTAHAALFGIPAYLIFCRIRKMKKGRTKTVLYSVWGLCVIGLVSITAVSTALGLPAFGPDGRLL